MARTQSQVGGAAGSTVIGPEIRVLGRVTGEEDLHVQGRVDGAISLTETLFVAAGGIVAAEVDALNVVVAGVIVGNVTARDCVTLHAGAKLVGDITAPRLVIADGAAFKGSVHMGGDSEEANAARSAARSRPAPPRRVAAPAPPPPRRATPVRVEPPRAPSKPAPVPADEEQTVIVRHRALADGDAAGESSTPSKPDAPDVARFRGVAATRAPARPEAPAAAKGKLPARARIPKPGKRRVNRR